MARSAKQYLRLLQSLLPKGYAWSRAEGSTLTEFLYGDAEEFARVDLRSENLLWERDTRRSFELLIDHEMDLGLPDECSPEKRTITERRLIAHTKLIALGRQDPAYFIELAAAMGWTVTITEYTPCWCGVGLCGDPCGDQWVIFYWKVTINFVAGVVTIWATSGSSESGDWISYNPVPESLICILNKYKPGHTTLTFGYDGPEYDEAFGPAFDALPAGEESHLYGEFWRDFNSAFDVHFGGEYSADEFGEDFRKPV